jgi:hypothetical protein
MLKQFFDKNFPELSLDQRTLTVVKSAEDIIDQFEMDFSGLMVTTNDNINSLRIMFYDLFSNNGYTPNAIDMYWDKFLEEIGFVSCDKCRVDKLGCEAGNCLWTNLG